MKGDKGQHLTFHPTDVICSIKFCFSLGENIAFVRERKFCIRKNTNEMHYNCKDPAGVSLGRSVTAFFQARVLMKKVKNSLGDINGTDSNFTLKRLVNMKPLLSGLEDGDLKKIEQDGTFSDKLHTIAKAPDMSREQVRHPTGSHQGEETSF